MRLYGAIQKIEPLDDGTVRVFGVASSESIDDQGEIVRGAAIRAALPDYMRFPALREMHQLSAAGTTLEADVGEDNITRITALVVDPVAVSKVKSRVYRGFSIGGKVTAREAGNPKTITGLVLNEISLVDRPANPEAIFDVWKASRMPPDIATPTASPPAQPEQIWACGNAEHLHKAKAEAIKCIAQRTNAGATAMQAAMDAALKAVETGEAALAKSQVHEQHETAGAPGNTSDDTEKAGDAPSDGKKPYGDVPYADSGHQSDGKKRYPIDTEAHIRAAWNYINKPKNAGKYSSGDLASIKSKIIAAWKSKIDKDGPPSAKKALDPADIAKSLWDIGEVAEMIGALRQLEERLEMETAMEGDDSSAPAKARACCVQLCQFLRDLVAEETSEVLDDTEIDEPVGLAAGAVEAIAEAIKSSIPDANRAEALVNKLFKAGARHNARDQALLDTAGLAIGKAMDMGSVSKGDRMHMDDAHKAVLDAGATDLRADGRQMLTNSNPAPDGGETEHSTTDTGNNGGTSVPNATGAVPATAYPPAAKGALSEAMLAVFLQGADSEKAGGMAHKPLLEVAHHCVAAVSDGSTCKEGAAKPTRHTSSTMASLDKAHFHLTKCGGMEMACKGGGVPGGLPDPNPNASAIAHNQGTTDTSAGGSDRGEPGKDAAAGPDDLAKQKSQIDQAGQSQPTLDELIKAVNSMADTMGKVVAQNTELRARVEDIAQQEVPPRAMVRTAGVSISKAQDGAPLTGSSATQPRLTPAELAAELAKLSPDDRVLTTIKASRMQPLHIHGITDGPAPGRSGRPQTS